MLKAAKVPAGRKEDLERAAAAKFVLCRIRLARGSVRPRRWKRCWSAALPDGVALGPAYGLRGLLALEHGRLTKALADAEKAVALSPADAMGYLVRGRVRLERAADGALEDLAKAVGVERPQGRDGPALAGGGALPGGSGDGGAGGAARGGEATAEGPRIDRAAEGDRRAAKGPPGE